MKKIKMYLLILLSFLTVGLYADAPVWKVSKNSNHIYIAGTMHILSKTDYPLKHEFSQAFVNSDDIVFEADLSEGESPEFQRYIREKSVYSKGKNIKDFLSKETYYALSKYLKSKNMPLSILNMKPGFILSTISIRLYSEAGFNVSGVDAFIEHQAKKRNKDRIYLETLKDQIEFISNLGIGNEESFIKYTLSEIDKSSVQIPLVHKAWKNGNTQVLEEYMNEFKTLFPRAYNLMITKRNNKWIGKIEKMFDSRDIEYVLVGFAHLAGEDSILKKLKALGYEIQRVKVTH